MNNDNLHELIKRYKENFEVINNQEHDELFKWKAIKQFQNVWFSEDAKNRSFPELFKDATKECGVLIDGQSMVPANGLVKIAEEMPDEVEYMFRDILFADDGGDLAVRQRNMEQFLAESERLRQKIYPRNWKYKQDNHSATCYLALFAPEQNFIYRYSNVEKFSRYVEFGLEIGSGSGFSLENYYNLCEKIVEALRQHDDLIDMHFKRITDEHYRDESLHIMAFDVVYCAWCYGYFDGLVYTKRTKKDYAIESEKAIIEAEAESLRLEIIEQEDLLHELLESISLTGVEVSSRDYGNGLITLHEGVHITVQFKDCVKKYEINRKYTQRPTFENDDEIICKLYEYADGLQRISVMRSNLSRLEKKLQ